MEIKKIKNAPLLIQSLETLIHSDPNTRLDFRLLETSFDGFTRYQWSIDSGRIITKVAIDGKGTAYIAKLEKGNG